MQCHFPFSLIPSNLLTRITMDFSFDFIFSAFTKSDYESELCPPSPSHTSRNSTGIAFLLLSQVQKLDMYSAVLRFSSVHLQKNHDRVFFKCIALKLQGLPKLSSYLFTKMCHLLSTKIKPLINHR